ncbi:MAG: hypothetical protein VX278_23020, partial [Myxococcota bacterium]|nr:hypothetical protein [Myxococcota bacterium]
IDTMFTIDTVPSSELIYGDVWVCIITVTDSDGASVSGSSSTQIRQSEPNWTPFYSSSTLEINGSLSASDTDGTQESMTLNGEDCWSQNASWNVLSIPIPRSGSDLEAIEIDFYTASQSSFALMPLSGYSPSTTATDFLSVGFDPTFSDPMTVSYGVEVSLDTEELLSVSQHPASFATNTWQTMRIEYDYLTNITSIYIDGTEFYSTDLLPLSDLQTDYLQLRSGFDCCSTPVDICWKDLVVYEGTP